MAKIEGVLRAEISRLSRKEVRAITAPLHREIRELRRAVARIAPLVEATLGPCRMAL